MGDLRVNPSGQSMWLEGWLGRKGDGRGETGRKGPPKQHAKKTERPLVRADLARQEAQDHVTVLYRVFSSQTRDIRATFVLKRGPPCDCKHPRYKTWENRATAIPKALSFTYVIHAATAHLFRISIEPGRGVRTRIPFLAERCFKSPISTQFSTVIQLFS